MSCFTESEFHNPGDNVMWSLHLLVHFTSSQSFLFTEHHTWKSTSHFGGSPGQYSIIFQATTHHPATSRYWLKKTLTEDLAWNILHNESLEVTWKLIMRWDASGYILIKEKECSGCWFIFHQQRIIMLDIKEKRKRPPPIQTQTSLTALQCLMLQYSVCYATLCCVYPLLLSKVLM